ncbi:CDP-6-deoxy-delta-3,4-glucoseen reductase [Variovorax dokdonensis]|uniref:CDP-6-deoxy-delta-3,4-glucoseen reductase n=1 Tax=Variovorax dokdonensis TaxID=344883 RepID=A0ABT7N6E2_9BURK|nr:CDP-6-deoxy-delta-3,4-glucoseen reductase [Variovorax dokdonensis]MDM0043491.1 CDP-6-deoxy-delta-3,4-glucoseen reductase [Variovorax dokdonensis]
MTAGAQAATHSIIVEPSGRNFPAADDETILSAAIRQGIGLPYGCKDGACGSCKCRKLSGEVEMGPHQSKALSAEEQAKGYVLTCCARARSDVVLESRQVTEAGAHPIRKMPVRVLALTRLSHDVMGIRLQLPAGEPLQFHAGQYIEFILQGGVRRSYSMANAPHTLATPGTGLELHVRHMPGGRFTDHVFGAMKEKEILRVEGPYGSFFLREESAKPIVLLASGTGFAPIKALLEHIAHKGIDRQVVLYWGGRRPQDLYMDEWMREQLAAMPQLRYVPVVSNAVPEDNWKGRTGFVHQAVLEDLPDLSGHQVYACGAPIVVESARRDYVAKAGLPEDEFFADAFTTEADKALP